MVSSANRNPPYVRNRLKVSLSAWVKGYLISHIEEGKKRPGLRSSDAALVHRIDAGPQLKLFDDGFHILGIGPILHRGIWSCKKKCESAPGNTGRGTKPRVKAKVEDRKLLLEIIELFASLSFAFIDYSFVICDWSLIIDNRPLIVEH
jgi:hypothetical protein